LSSNSNLTALAALVKSTSLSGVLSSLNNVTILAPSNSAIAALVNSSSTSNMTDNTGMIRALLEYHVLKGTYYSSQIGDTPAFVPTMLTNATYSNVTGGQVVEVEMMNGNVTIVSG